MITLNMAGVWMVGIFCITIGLVGLYADRKGWFK